jgi:hypothetical protein
MSKLLPLQLLSQGLNPLLTPETLGYKFIKQMLKYPWQYLSTNYSYE